MYARSSPATCRGANPPLPTARRSKRWQAQLALERAFAELPETYREVALLVGVEGLQPVEVAGILGVRPDAVRQRLSRAREKLAAALGEHMPESWRSA